MKLNQLWKARNEKKPPQHPANTVTNESENGPWDKKRLEQLFFNCADVKIDQFKLGSEESPHVIELIYCTGLTETMQVNQFVLPRLGAILSSSESLIDLDKKLELIRLDDEQDIVSHIFSGQLLVYVEQTQLLYSMDLSKPPRREPSESNTEVSIKGPKDGFVEELAANVALIRKRLPTKSLCYEQFRVGKRSNSKVALLYIQDIASADIIQEVRERLQKIEIDAILGSSQLEKMIADYSGSLFPLLDFTGRPDYAADSLVHGRFVVIADTSPNAIIGPANLTLLLKSPEDAYFPFYYASLGILLRLIGLVLSLLLPGFWTALTAFNVEQIPYPLVATISLSRIGLPLPGPLEAVMMITMFELFREAGERLPKAVGQTVAVVGGIVVGDAAIRAGLASTTLLVVSAVTAVSSFTLVNQSLVGSVSLIRYFVLICSSVLGMYGFMISTIAIVVYLSRLESFGVPYLAPLSPITWTDFMSAITRKSWFSIDKRPSILRPKDATRRGGSK
ncbi:spore germination protein [Paenibacillus athensensis]|uniref:Spore germination protein n=1 Tax=Paenibacillus athensensis TaxID=1967502 RepID=A0A4Y8Q939_9BACL|nr:spore germination protein [Paenibacillus athensensis]MCD1257423.1 spore germination protein [Paenibacillus athensensis]